MAKGTANSIGSVHWIVFGILLPILCAFFATAGSGQQEAGNGGKAVYLFHSQVFRFMRWLYRIIISVSKA